MFNRRRLPVDLLALVLLGLVVFVGVALFTFDPADPPGETLYPPNEDVVNLLGPPGAIAANNLRNLLGLAAWILPVALGSCGLSWLLRQEHDRPLTPLIGWTILVLSVATMLRGTAPGMPGAPPVGSGGYLGALVWTVLDAEFTATGVLILVGCVTAAGLLLAFDRWSWRVLLFLIVTPYELFHRLGFGTPAEEPPPAVPSTKSPGGRSAAIASPTASPSQGPAAQPAQTSPKIEPISRSVPPVNAPPGISPRGNSAPIRINGEMHADVQTQEATPPLPEESGIHPGIQPDIAADPVVAATPDSDPQAGGPTAAPAAVAVASDAASEGAETLGAIHSDDPPRTAAESHISGDDTLELQKLPPVIIQPTHAGAEIEEPDGDSPGKIVVPPIGVIPHSGAASNSTPREEGATLTQSAQIDEADVSTAADNRETSSTGPSDPTDTPNPTGDRPPIRINPPVHTARTTAVPTPRLVAKPDYRLPTADILEPAEPFPFEILAEKARAAAAILERTFQEFGLNVRVVEIDTGPVITQFELELEAGLRLSKVTALADDLAIALRVASVRVVAPIPGKNTVGVEVPNDKQVMVRLRELIEAAPDAGDKKRIPVFLGKDVSGRPLVVDLAKMPHLLIAGRTGTGKSVCLNALILSILMTRTPEQVKMLMVDPKMVELSPYKRVPHLMHPVITDMKKAEAVLGWAVDKMEERYDLLARCGVRHLDSYNELGREQILRKLGLEPDSEEADQIPDRMPYIVIIADEMADMMMTSGKEVEGFIIRLAQKSRAVGIHLVLATQKPTVDVITGLIKSNLPARIAFQVASRVDSRVVLDEMGAERLLGNGDMLYLIPGTSKMTRAQGTYVSDNEVNSIIEFFSDCDPEYSRELAQLSTRAKGKSGIDAIRSRDEMYEQAIDVVVREGRGSVSLLQRALGIGYGRAARLVDYMAEDGIVGDYNGSQAREVLYTPEQWAELVAGGEPAEVG